MRAKNGWELEASTYLPAAPDQVWEHLMRPALLRHVAFPLVLFVSREHGGFPVRWREGPHRVWMFQFGFLPLGPQTIGIEIGPHEGSILHLRDNGSGLLARTWDHRIVVAPEGGGTRYTDRVRVDARWLTPVVWAFASLFYRWRQHRWRVLVRNGFKY